MNQTTILIMLLGAGIGGGYAIYKALLEIHKELKEIKNILDR